MVAQVSPIAGARVDSSMQPSRTVPCRAAAPRLSAGRALARFRRQHVAIECITAFPNKADERRLAGKGSIWGAGRSRVSRGG